MLKKTILENWETDIAGHTQIISDLIDTGYPAYTIKLGCDYGVAIPYGGDEEINENFAGAKIWTEKFMPKSGGAETFLLLTSYVRDIEEQFAMLCEAFVDPGDHGANRREILFDPVGWWKKWKKLLGNRSVDERIYDVLGELCALLYVARNGEDAKWNGPYGASYDIETNARFVEVKSTVDRSKKEITISNQFQLCPEGKPLYLVFCTFEPCAVSGLSIDGLMDKLADAGCDSKTLNDRLERLGFENGMSARKREFILHEMLLYFVDDAFPRIKPESFVDGHLPKSITGIKYTADISGLKAETIELEELFDE